MRGRSTQCKTRFQANCGVLKFAVVLLTALTLLAFPIQAQNQGSYQVASPKASQPPPRKQGSSPPPPVGGKTAPSATPGEPTESSADVSSKLAAPPVQGPITSDDDPRVKAAIARAANFLRSRLQNQLPRLGELALIVHALAKIHEKYPDIVGAGDPALQRGIDQIRTHCPSDGYRPQRQGGHDNYEAGCVAMALTAADGQAYRSEVSSVLQYILSKQQENGAWSYTGNYPGGDTSMTQYAILGMWEAGAGAGIQIPREIWDRVAQWLIKTQNPDGGFAYHPPEASAAAATRPPSTHTMTVASLGSLYICRDHLPGGKIKNTRGQILLSTDDEEQRRAASYKANTARGQINDATKKAMEWLSKNFTLDKAKGESDSGGGRWFYYYLYAFERLGTLSDLKQINGVDWYAEGARLILSRQAADGSWTEGDGPDVNTAFAVLFLVRSTHISQKIHLRRLGRGTLVSGRGLPQHLHELEQTNVGLRVRALPGKTGDLLKKIETGNVEELEGAAAGLIRQMYEKKWSAAGEEGDRLKKMYELGIKTQNSEVIKAALKLLALTADFRVVPILIDAMYYEEDAAVQIEARKALCLISRKFNGFGTIFPEEAGKEEWEQEIERWKKWYKQVRPESAFEDEVEVVK